MARGQSDQSEFPTELSPEQTQTKKYIAFDKFDTMDTQPAREALDKSRFSWLKNVIILAHNQMTVLAGPASTPLTTLSGETIKRMFYCFLNGVDYMVCFCASGAAYGVNLSTGSATMFAPSSTFSVVPDATQWADEALLIGDPTAGYCAWTGTLFAQPGSASPSFNIIVGGSNYVTVPNVTITGGTGHGATATAVLAGGAVTEVDMTNLGTGYVDTDDLLVFFTGGTPTPATVTSFDLLETGANYATAPTVTITPHPLDTTGTGATATAAVSSGSVTALTLTAGGSGYTATPYVSIDGGSGPTNATITAGTLTVVAGAITAIPVGTGGSNYTSTPMVFIIGDGVGAAATATLSSGVVTAITVIAGGTGYTNGNTRVFVGGGGGALAAAVMDNVASATTQVWPTTIKPTTLAVFQGRVWLALGRELVYTGTTGYSDFDAANASGSTTITDSDLVHKVTALRSLNNYLFIFGDNSIKQIGSVTVSNSITNFSIVTLSSDIGTLFPMSIASYNRLVVFCNTQGIYAVFGASVEKISDTMDGLFRGIDFSQEPVGIVDDLLNLHTYQLLVRYNGALDPSVSAPENLIIVFTQKRWCVADQGTSMTFIVNAPLATIYNNNQDSPFGTSGNDLTELWINNTSPRNVVIQSSLSYDENPFINKRAIRMGIAQSVSTSGSQLTVSLDTENGSNTFSEALGFEFTWLNANNVSYLWKNSLNQTFYFVGGSGFDYLTSGVTGSGIYLGATLTGQLYGYNAHAITIEYQTGALFASRNI
jgi:hypothetical protein